jgi:hypothetical protein
MSALDQKRTFAPQKVMFGFSPESGHSAMSEQCPLGAKADIGHLHSITSLALASSVVGTVRPSAFAVLMFDHQLELGLRLHRQVGSKHSRTCWVDGRHAVLRREYQGRRHDPVKI